MKHPYRGIQYVAFVEEQVRCRANRQPRCYLFQSQSSAEYLHRPGQDCCMSNPFHCQILQKESSQIHLSTTAGSYAFLKKRLCFLSASQDACSTDSLTGH